MAYKEGSGIKCEATFSVEKGVLKGQIVCQKLKDGVAEGKPHTDIISIPGNDDMALGILGGRLKVSFMEAFNWFHE